MDRTYSLKNKKDIEALFTRGKRLKAYPVTLVYAETDSYEGYRIAFSVPKRIVKSAVHRNRIKRQMREAFRANKDQAASIIEKSDKAYALMLIFQSNKESSVKVLSEKILLILDRFKQHV